MYGDKGLPCLTPLFGLKGGPNLPFTITSKVVVVIHCQIQSIHLLENPKS